MTKLRNQRMTQDLYCHYEAQSTVINGAYLQDSSDQQVESETGF